MTRDELERMSWAARNRYYQRLYQLRRKLPALEPYVAVTEARRLQHEIPFDPPEVIAARRQVLESLTLPASMRKKTR